MNLYRFKLIPESAWRTPWQSDTLSGMLCGTIAQLEGDTVLRERVIDPALAGRPPFVVSDAFPGDWLPIPAVVRLLNWPSEHRKDVKRARWLSRESFQAFQRDGGIAKIDLIDKTGFHESTQLHNTIGRAGSTTLEDGGIFSCEESLLAEGQSHITVYVRLNDEFRDLFWRAIRELATWGFGADRSAGKGQFRVDGELEPIPFLDQVNQPNGSVVLSTFQPNVDDPTDGAWDTFTKYGKLGPEFGLTNVFKRPLVLFKPGASFRVAEPRPWFGRAIPMDYLLAPDACASLRGRNVEVIHYAFGLAVPIIWPTHMAPRPGDAEITGNRPNPALSRFAPPPASRQMVEVTLLERMEKTGPNDFRVQEEGKAKGMLNHGTPPNPLPEVGAKVRVYREPTSQPSNPSYRWSPPAPPAPQQRGGRSNPPRR